jgi:hypothetical protein
LRRDTQPHAVRTFVRKNCVSGFFFECSFLEYLSLPGSVQIEVDRVCMHDIRMIPY